MSTIIATVATIVFVVLLILLAREPKDKVSPLLWVPVTWILIGSTRNVSEWFQVGPAGDAVDRYMEGNPFDRNILTVLIGLGCATLFLRRRQVSSILRRNGPIVAYVVFCGLSVMWSLYPLVATKRWLRALGDIIMVLVIATDVDFPAALRQVMKRVSVLVLPFSVLLIRYYPDLGRAYGLDGTPYARGVAGGKNGLGAICLIFGIFSLWQFLLAWQMPHGRTRRRRLSAYGCLFAVAVYLLYISRSETSLACFVLIGVLMAVTMITSLPRHRRLLSFLVLSVISACAAVLFLGVGTGALEAIGRDPTLTGRTEVWKLVLRFADNPVAGAGYESFWMGTRLQQITAINGGINQAHNGYIEVYLNLGWIGVGLLIIILVSSLSRAIGGIRPRDPLSPLLLAYIIVASIYNFTEAAFKMMSPIWLFFLLSAMTIRLPSRAPAWTTNRERQHEQHAQRAWPALSIHGGASASYSLLPDRRGRI